MSFKLSSTIGLAPLVILKLVLSHLHYWSILCVFEIVSKFLCIAIIPNWGIETNLAYLKIMAGKIVGLTTKLNDFSCSQRLHDSFNHKWNGSFLFWYDYFITLIDNEVFCNHKWKEFGSIIGWESNSTSLVCEHTLGKAKCVNIPPLCIRSPAWPI